ncbi:MAG: nucleoside monophosphate kinase [Cyclobacteriaceae bacterium]|nr:nucleoside monophosphate kinase [Cyclobacteriaceae bacterium]
MRISLMGPPGSGKGTQGDRLSEALSIPKISTGDLIRAEIASGSDRGKEIESDFHRGKLSPPDLVVSLVQARVEQQDCSNGFILDGSPRTVEEAHFMQENGLVDIMFVLDLPDEVLIERMVGRRIDPSSGKTYNVSLGLPDVDLVTREMDSDPRARIQEFKSKSLPAISMFRSDIRIHVNGVGTPNQVYIRIIEALLRRW